MPNQPSKKDDPLKGLKRGVWSKYGGGQHALDTQDLSEEWVCQACSVPQIDLLSPYLFEFVPREYVRICAKCQAMRTRLNITSFEELISLCRNKPLLY
jgi:hypothetical protein